VPSPAAPPHTSAGLITTADATAMVSPGSWFVRLMSSVSRAAGHRVHCCSWAVEKVVPDSALGKHSGQPAPQVSGEPSHTASPGDADESTNSSRSVASRGGGGRGGRGGGGGGRVGDRVDLGACLGG